jgi:TPR repeat protein
MKYAIMASTSHAPRRRSERAGVKGDESSLSALTSGLPFSTGIPYNRVRCDFVADQIDAAPRLPVRQHPADTCDHQIYRFLPIMLRFSLLIAALAFGASSALADPLNDAVKALDSGRHGQAIQLLTPLANNGNPLAQYRLGMIYYLGKGVPEDEAQAIRWWKKAAAQGYTEAMFALGSAYLFGSQAAKTVPDGDREAAIWYFQAASAGHAEAQYHLGLLFLGGKGVIESRTEAAFWFRKAADQGHTEAKKALATVEKAPPR